MTTDRRTGVIGNAAIKVPCRACSTTNITLSGTQTVDGVAIVADDRVLVTGQTSSVNNGIYVADTGAWTRSTDMDGTYDIVTGTLIKVNSGTSNSGFWYVSTTGTPVIGTDAINFGMSSTVLAIISAFMQTMLDDVDAAAARSTLGLGSMALAATTSYVANALLTTTGDSVQASAASTPARLAAKADVAAHATTMNLWAARENVLTGGAVTITDIVDAPFVGAVTWVKMNAAHIWDDGAVFDVQGGADYTSVAGDWVRIYATTVSTFEVTIFKENGRAVTATTNITLMTPQATTSGTTKDFTIPTGTKRITVMFSGVSTNGTSNYLIQIGDAGGIEVAGYVSQASVGAAVANSTAGFIVSRGIGAAAGVMRGHYTLCLENPATFTWTGGGNLYHSNAPETCMCAGDKSLTQELTTVRITTVSADTFDLGEVNVSYE